MGYCNWYGIEIVIRILLHINDLSKADNSKMNYLRYKFTTLLIDDFSCKMIEKAIGKKE